MYTLDCKYAEARKLHNERRAQMNTLQTYRRIKA